MNYELNIVFRMDLAVGFVIFLFLRIFPLLIHARNPTEATDHLQLSRVEIGTIEYSFHNP